MIDMTNHKMLTIKSPINSEDSIEIYPYVDSESMIEPLSVDKGGTGVGTAKAALTNLGIDVAINSAIGTLREELTENITQNQNNITQNQKDITQNQKDITQNQKDITQNQNNITQNQNNITQNQKDIAQNQKDINALKSSVNNLDTTKVSKTDILSNGKILREKISYWYGTELPESDSEPKEGDIFFLRASSSS